MKRYYKGKKVDDINSESSEEETDEELQEKPLSSPEASLKESRNENSASFQDTHVGKVEPDSNTVKEKINSTDHSGETLEKESSDNRLSQDVEREVNSSSHADLNSTGKEFKEAVDSTNELPASIDESSEESSDESSEESSESSDSSSTPQILKPVFIRRSKNVKPSSAPDPDQEKNIILNNLQHFADRARETKVAPPQKDYLALDDTDDIDPEKEKLDWKIRELQRIKRERDALIAKDKEYEEMQARRSLHDSP